MPRVELDDVALYYERRGSGPRLLVANGSGTSLDREPNPFSWPVANGFDLVAYDHRGLGRSEALDPDHQPAMGDYADDALGLADSLGWDAFALLGVSFGGMVAQHVALLGEGRVERMVLACTSSGGRGGSSYPLHELTDLPAEERADRMVALIDTRTADDPDLEDLFVELIRQGVSASATAEPTEGLRRQLDARRGHDTWAELPSLDVPTLVAAGRYDGIAPPDNAEALARRIPGARLQVFEGGHAFLFQDRDAWPTITDFLAG